MRNQLKSLDVYRGILETKCSAPRTLEFSVNQGCMTRSWIVGCRLLVLKTRNVLTIKRGFGAGKMGFAGMI